ncbi:MAG: restriction endonuclease [Flavobacteriaceae bacterium]
MRNTLSYEEINDGTHFEELVSAYFRDIKEDKNNSISNVELIQSGVGSDGGVDILVDFLISDDIKIFNRRWIVQCKFWNQNIPASAINKINIPTLIHSYKASGYLLICKSNPTETVTKLFTRLNKECRYNYHYEYWDGRQFLQKLKIRRNLFDVFFPEHNEFLISKISAQ